MPPSEPSKRRHKTRSAPPLTAREIRFCQNLIAGDGPLLAKRNQTRAYLDAGFPAPNEPAAAVYASRLVRKRKVREYLRTLQEVAAEAARITVEELAVLMSQAARADLRRLYDAKGRILPPHKWPDDVASAVEGVESEEIYKAVPGSKGRKELAGYARKLKLAGKNVARRTLMEWLGMLRPPTELPPLELLLAALPANIAEAVRAALASALHAGGDRNGGASGGPKARPVGEVPQ